MLPLQSSIKGLWINANTQLTSDDFKIFQPFKFFLALLSHGHRYFSCWKNNRFTIRMHLKKHFPRVPRALLKTSVYLTVRSSFAFPTTFTKFSLWTVNSFIFSVASRPSKGVRSSLTTRNLTLYLSLFLGFTTGSAEVPAGFTLVPFHITNVCEHGVSSSPSAYLSGKMFALAPQST